MRKVEYLRLWRNKPLWVILLLIIFYPSRSLEGTIATGFEASGDWDSQTTEQWSHETTKVSITTGPSNFDQIDITTMEQVSTTFEPVTKTYPLYANHHAITKNRTTTEDDASSDDSDSIDIIPIVGAICGVIGLLFGIIISAGLWLYISRKRMTHAASIAKNPEEKTFERLDFNLTLPREEHPQDTEGSRSSSSSNSPKDLPQLKSSYLHFDEPTPFEMDVYQTESHSNTPANKLNHENDQNRVIYEVQEHYKQNSDNVDKQDDRNTTEYYHHYLPKSKSYEPSMAIAANRYEENKHARLSAYSVLQQDSSDQSTISRMSSSVTGVGPRRSSTCTYRTDLPDSDGSNSSTCGGTVSITSSLAREKPYKGIDFIPSSRSSYLSDTYTSSTRVPYYANEPPAHIHDDSEYEEHNDETSLSSSDLFIDGADNNTFEHAEDDGMCSNLAKEEKDVESSLSYFDLKLPPATFGSHKQPKLSTCYNVEEIESEEESTFHRHSATPSPLSEEFTIKRTISENTINL